MRWRTAAGFTNGHTDARKQQLSKVADETAYHRHATPQRQAYCQQIAPHRAVRQSRYGDADEGVEDGECDAAEEPHLRIRKLQLFFYGLSQNAQNRAVEEIEDINYEQYAQRVPGSPWHGGLRLLFRRCRRGSGVACHTSPAHQSALRPARLQ